MGFNNILVTILVPDTYNFAHLVRIFVSEFLLLTLSQHFLNKIGISHSLIITSEIESKDLTTCQTFGDENFPNVLDNSE
jgi:hypothetical protein